MTRVTIVGTTTWGTTLAILLGRKDVSSVLLTRTVDEARYLRASGENLRFLPGVPFPPALTISARPEEALENPELIILAVPSQKFRENLLWIRDSVKQGTVVLSATKGLEMETGNRMSQVIEEELPSHISESCCVLSGPNLAKEVVSGKPASTVIASKDLGAATLAQSLLMSPKFRVYTNEDVIGVELGGALKNIIAIGSGISDGLGYGDNAKSAFVTRGLSEITRLGEVAGANPRTFAGLAGLGDIMATCHSQLSRNRFVGEELAKGKSLEEIMSNMGNIAEGVFTASAAMDMAKSYGTDLPITSVTHRILLGELDVVEAISQLMGRPPRSE